MSARRVAILMFDGVEVLDFAGPFEVFGVTGWRQPPQPFDVFTVAQHRGTVLARNNLRIETDYDFASCPASELFVIPGGLGTRREVHNPALVRFVKERVDAAELALSVCTGALLLAKTGLLEGLEATTHTGAMDLLRDMAPNTVIHPEARGVDNGKIVLSTGISAGIDMALYCVSRLIDAETAAETADYMQYDWRHRTPDGQSVVRAAA